MKSINNVGLENVQAVYGGAEGDLWEPVMVEQVHVGGFQSSTDLAKRAGIGLGMQGIDLCCCDGTGMRFLAIVKLPNTQDFKGYKDLLTANGCHAQVAEDAGRFAPCVDLHMDRLNKLLTYDALRIIGFDMALMQALGGEMVFTQQLAHAGKIVQGIFIARKKQ